MVHQHRIRYAVFFKTFDNASPHLVATRGFEREDTDRESTVIVQETQGITTLDTTQDVLTLEVHLPQLVRFRTLKTFHCWTASIPFLDQSVAIYDPINHAMIIFAGQDAGGRVNDVWSFDLATNMWSELTPSTGPMPAAF